VIIWLSKVKGIYKGQYGMILQVIFQMPAILRTILSRWFLFFNYFVPFARLAIIPIEVLSP
jgi:hypothetical protein